MSIGRRLAGHLRLGRKSAGQPDILRAPVTWSPGGPAVVTTKVDQAVRLGQSLIVGGWSSGNAGYRLAVAGAPVPTRAFRTSRPDVASYLGRDASEMLGIVLVADDAPDGPVELECLGNDGDVVAGHRMHVQQGLVGQDARAQLEPALVHLRDAGLHEDPAGIEADDALEGDFALGVLDEARSSSDVHEAVASGWLVSRPTTRAWIETSDGRRFPLDDAHRVPRADVASSLPSAHHLGAGQPGFLVRLPGVAPGERLTLVADGVNGPVTLAGTTCTSWGTDPVAASRWLFAFPTPPTGLADRIAKIDLPVLSGLIQAAQKCWADLPVRFEVVGQSPGAPRVSIIVPLYGRLDFVEHQLLEFARDPWLLAHAEVVYVVDDPALVDPMAGTAWMLHDLYQVPFRWVWGGVNRGFAGANNLGAAQSEGDVLVFLNSDAFPREPGWLQALVAPLQDDPGIGAVGPRLLFGDGSLQHAGMAFRRRHDLGIWTNIHPRMGLEPSLDPHTAPTDVPCVTGACMALRRGDFDAVGGWDTGYLVGDFEDSDLCLKLREAGRRIVYLPHVVLTHLERQSFKLLGSGDYRTRVVIWNGVRHQQRWRASIEALAADPSRVQEAGR